MKEEASVVFKEGKYEEAIVLFKQCLELDKLNSSFNSTILFNISFSYEKLGKKDEQLIALNQAIKYNPKYGKALIKRGDLYVAMEEFNDGIRDYSEASEQDASFGNVQGKLKDA